MNKLILFSVILSLMGLLVSPTFASTTIQLQDADTENLDDTHIDAGVSHNYEFGSFAIIHFGDLEWSESYEGMESYYKFNLSSIPSNGTVIDAQLYIYFYQDNVEVDDWGTYGNTLVYNNYTVDGQEWVEGDCTSFAGCIAETGEINWDEKPVSGYYNSTIETTVTINDGFIGWKNWTSTGLVTNALSYNYKNITIRISETSTALEDGDHFSSCSKESSIDNPGGCSVSKRPYLNITYIIYTPPAINNQQISTNHYNGTVNLSDINFVTNKKSLKVNVSATNANLQSVWARLYNSVTDYLMSLVSGTTYDVDIDLSKGSYNISSFANDSVGNENNTANTSITVSDLNLSTYLTLSDYYWDSYSEITANSTVDKVKYINDTGTGVSDKVNVLGYYIDGSDCEVNDIVQSVAGGVCEYTHTINKGNNWSDLELYDSNYGNGTPVTMTETSIEVATDGGLEVKKKNVTISHYYPNGSSAGAGTFTNSTSLNICTDSTVTGTPFLRWYNGSSMVDISPTNNATWELKTVGSKSFWVIQDDFCGGSDGVLDFKVKIVSND